MNPDDWMKASDYNELRAAILNGHQHTGGWDGPQLNALNFQTGSITRDRFSTRDKYIFAHCYVWDGSSEIEPIFSSTYNWGRRPESSTVGVEASATFPYPCDAVGSDFILYLHVANTATRYVNLIFLEYPETAIVKVINAGDSYKVTAETDHPIPTVAVSPETQILVKLGEVSLTALSQPAMISVYVKLIRVIPRDIYFNGLVLKYTSRP